MKKILICIVLCSACFSNAWAVPKITGTPVIVTPQTLLEWPGDFKTADPYLTEPTANRLNDFHGVIRDCDIVLSTAGNYHMALRELWQLYLSKYAGKLNIRNWYYTTSPPISPQQVKNKVVQFGNLEARCIPQIAVGPGKLIKKLQTLGLVQGKPVPILKNNSNVIFVKKGNPKNIKSVWDLGRDDVTLVTPNPKMESGSFGNFSGSIYNIAKNDPNPPKGESAEALFNSIFNSDQSGCGDISKRCKWVSGKRIMHREQPWAVDTGNADAGFIFYHLALYFTRTFPDKFEIIPLGGTAENPKPLKGNKVGVLKAVRIKGKWNKKQKKAADRLMDALKSKDFEKILNKHGINKP